MNDELWTTTTLEGDIRLIEYRHNPPSWVIYLLQMSDHTDDWPASIIVDEDGPYCILDKLLSPDELSCLLDGTIDVVDFVKDLMN